MEELGIDKLKQIQLDMLKDIHVFCVEHGIRYSLAFGTLLGAVRHKGYIPWDDDVDIMMPRDDYNRFIRSYGNQIYKIADMSVNPDYDLPFAKVEDVLTVIEEDVEGGSVFGVYIDVFPVDYIPDNMLARRTFYKMKSLLNTLFDLKTVRLNKSRSLLKNIVLAISHVLLFFISKQQFACWLSKWASRYQGRKTTCMGIVAPSDSRIEEAIPSCFFETYVLLPFEHLNVMSIKDYDKYLTAAYGDYMKLPPIENRVSHHVFKAWTK